MVIVNIRLILSIVVMILNGVLVFAFIFFLLKGLITDDRKQFTKMMVAVIALVLVNLLNWFVFFSRIVF